MVAPANPSSSPADDAAQLGLAVIAEAAAVTTRDDKVIHAAAENLQDTVDALVDEPMTDQQEEVVQSLGAVAGSLLAGVSGALAAQQDVPVEKVLGGSARVLLGRAQLASDTGADET